MSTALISFRITIFNRPLFDTLEEMLKTQFNREPDRVKWFYSMMEVLAEYLEIPVELVWHGNWDWGDKELPAEDQLITIELSFNDDPDNWPDLDQMNKDLNRFFLNNWSLDAAFAFYQAIYLLGMRQFRHHFTKRDKGAELLKQLKDLYQIPP